jgi:hypothetical protein
MRKPSSVSELRLALALAVGLAATCFGTAIVAANFLTPG